MKRETTIQECWLPADKGQLRLIRAWKKEELKQHIVSGLLIVFLLVLVYVYIVCRIYGDYPHGGVIWKSALLLAVILAAVLFTWWEITREDMRDFWKSRFYARHVVCVGHTKISTRYQYHCYLDVADESGEIFEEIEVDSAVLDSVRHQETVLAVTRTPDQPRPEYLFPLHRPKKRTVGDYFRGK
ncbi:MAG: hypothetical protein LUH04_16485 [Clostridium sp.]|nr:hypothetical protein [Clostridium sp.]